MDDLFGHVPQQRDMFASAAPSGAPPLPAPIKHTPDTIRAKMMTVLAQVRAADTIPWSPREQRSHTAMFPYWSEWLPPAEGGQLLLEFRAELRRLGAPEKIVVPDEG